MAKTQDEINELLSSELFTRGIEDGYISVNDEHTTIRYNCKNQNKSRSCSIRKNQSGCDIIVTACRTKWTTYNKVDIDLQRNGYDIIWTSNDRYYNKSQTHIIDILNDRYAKRIIQLIEDRIAGII